MQKNQHGHAILSFEGQDGQERLVVLMPTSIEVCQGQTLFDLLEYARVLGYEKCEESFNPTNESSAKCLEAMGVAFIVWSHLESVDFDGDSMFGSSHRLFTGLEYLVLQCYQPVGPDGVIAFAA